MGQEQNSSNHKISFIPVLSENNTNISFVCNEKENIESKKKEEQHSEESVLQKQGEQVLINSELNQETNKILRKEKDNMDKINDMLILRDDENINITPIKYEKESNQEMKSDHLPKIKPSHIPNLKNKEKDKSKSKDKIKAKEKREKSGKINQDDKKCNIVEM